ncbi:MAG: hypothetical protein NTX61_02325 [Bacteroidetes bacterium]|nr:hypothetical protein [Bacteroidota bacterium]
MMLYLSVLLLLGFPQVHDKQTVSFVEEYIEFRLDGSEFTVNGLYVFVNNANAASSTNIFYPFPVAVSAIDSVFIFDNSAGKFLEFSKGKNGVNFNLQVPSRDTLKLNIFYRQKDIKDSVRYILTTTRYWGKPLVEALYTFELRKSRKINSFSYDPDRASVSGDWIKYSWRKQHFMPDRDFIAVLADQ